MPSMMATEMNYVVPGILVKAHVLSVIYSKWANGNYNLQSGFKFGALLGLFVGPGINMVRLGTLELIDLQGSLVDAVWNVVYIGIAGCLNGWIFKGLD